MFKSEYFSNSYKSLITNKPFHFLVLLLEYILTLISQVTLFVIKFNFKMDEDIPSGFFYAIFIQKLNKLPEYVKLLIVIIAFISIFAYFFIYNKYFFEYKCIFNIIAINIFEIIIFRLAFLILLHIVLAIEGIPGIVINIILIPILGLIIHNFIFVHLYYYSPHFITYPYDFYSSMTDVFHIIEKISISIALQSTIKNFNHLLYIGSFILQIGCFMLSIFILYYKSYYFMNNIFLSKVRLSFVIGTLLNNLILLLLGNKNYILYSFLLIVVNVYLGVFLLVLIFINPYSFAYFVTDEYKQNLYFYYFIIDHLKNDSFLLEEKIREHFNRCQKCNLCTNLKNYLAKKKCYKKVYKILYNKIGVLEHTINELIHIVLIKGKEELKNNSFYLINLMYCYYINLNKKDYVLSLNLKLLFEIINSENKNILENHQLSTEQIFLINDFLSKADKILDTIKLVLTETLIKERISHFFDLYEILFDLKSKKFRTNLYYNKNEGIINFFKYISICSMIYEEIFNSSLSSGGMTLKENQVFLDDIANKNSSDLNQIIIQLDLLSFENRILYIVGELAKYKGKALCQLFPNIFKMQQLYIMKNKIMNSKYLVTINKDKDFFQNYTAQGKKIEEQYICLKLLIYDEVEHKKYFVIISLKLNLIYPIGISKKILLTGFYSVDKNIIITLDKSTNQNKKEIVLNSEENKYTSELRNYSSNEVELIKYKNNDKYFSGKKLLFVTKFYVNPNCYNIYSIFHSERQRTYKMDKIKDDIQKNSNLFDMESKNNILAESTTQNFNYMMMSQTSSTFNQMGNDIQGFKKRDKGGKKEKKKNLFFKYYQLGLLFLAIFILLFEIIAHITLYNSILKIDRKNTVATWLKNFNGIFNNMFGTTLTISCLVDTPRGDKCSSIISEFSQKFFPPFPLQHLPERHPPLDLVRYLFAQNQGLCNPLGTVRQNILKVLTDSDDESLNDLIYSKMVTLSILQNITDNGTKLVAYKEINSFIDTLNIMTTGFIVLNSNDSNTQQKIYILNRTNISENWNSTEEPFKNVKVKGELTHYQYYFYYLILNYQQFLQKLDEISNSLFIATDDIVLSNVSTIKAIIIILLVCYFVLQIIVYFYIQEYYKIIADLFSDIEKKLDLKNDEISVREMFIQKVEKLKIIISLYKQDIYQAIVDLNFIYDNYKKFIEEKNKEIAKYLKKEKFLNENNFNSNDKSKKLIKKQISSISSNIFYIYFIIFCAVVSLIISLVLFFVWNSYLSIYNRVQNLISAHGDLSADAYKIVNYYQLMIYGAITFDDINYYEGLTSKGENLFQKLYTDLENVYESKKNMQNLKSYNLDNIDKYFDFTCETFYDYLYPTTPFLINYPFSEDYRPYLIKLCEQGNVFKSKNYKHIFSMLFEMIQIGINQINDHSYEGIMSIVKSEHYINATIEFFFVYYNTFEILTFRVQRQSYEKLSQLIDKYLHTGFIIYYIASIVFIAIIGFLYVYTFNRKYHKLYEMKKVFKICNKRE